MLPTPVQGEHRARETGPALHVEELERLADLPVRDLLVARPGGFGRPDVDAGPPATDLDVVGFTGAGRRILVGDVRKVKEPISDLLSVDVGLNRRRTLVVAVARRLCSLSWVARASSPGLLGGAHLAAQRLDLGPDRFGVREAGPVGHIGVDDLIDLRFCHPATSQGSLDRIGILAEKTNIDHACSK